jgi:hypothetical protein
MKMDGNHYKSTTFTTTFVATTIIKTIMYTCYWIANKGSGSTISF